MGKQCKNVCVTHGEHKPSQWILPSQNSEVNPPPPARGGVHKLMHVCVGGGGLCTAHTFVAGTHIVPTKTMTSQEHERMHQSTVHLNNQLLGTIRHCQCLHFLQRHPHLPILPKTVLAIGYSGLKTFITDRDLHEGKERCLQAMNARQTENQTKRTHHATAFVNVNQDSQLLCGVCAGN